MELAESDNKIRELRKKNKELTQELAKLKDNKENIQLQEALQNIIKCINENGNTFLHRKKNEIQYLEKLFR